MFKPNTQQNIVGGWAYEVFVEFLWGHHKIGLYLEAISKHCRVFSEFKVHNGGYFWGC